MNGINNQKTTVMSEWEKALNYLQRDLRYLWKDITPEFEKLKSKEERILLVFKKLKEYYEQNQKKNSEEIFTLNSLIMFLQYDSINNLHSLIESSLFNKIFNAAEKEFFRQKLEAITKKSKKVDFQQETDVKPTQMPIDLKKVKIGLRKIWMPVISKDLAAKGSTAVTNGLNSFFIYLSRNLGRVPEKILISAILAPILIGAFPERGGGGYLRLRSDKEVIRQVLGADFVIEKVQKMLEASEFGDGLAGVMNEYQSGNIKYENLPDYIKELISDGVLDIAVFIGARLEKYIPLKKDEIRLINFAQKKVVLRVRYVDSIEKAVIAFNESDVIYVHAHSLLGLGWPLSKEGIANPLRMQPSPIKIPKKHLKYLYGYKGPILKDLGDEVIVQASDEDIKRIKPRKGYQIIAATSCQTSKYFLDTLKRLRDGLPTTIIYTNADVTNGDATILLNGVLKGEKIEKIVEDINTYELKSWTSKDKAMLKSKQPYESLVLNAEAGSSESKAYDKNNIRRDAIMLFYDIEL